MFYQFSNNQAAWLGEGGMVIGDGGFGQDDFVMTPYSNAETNSEPLFPHCFSSTCFYVEQCFGWWKNRWRILIRASQLTHEVQCALIYTTMILHNVCVVEQENKSSNWTTLLGQPIID